MCGCGIDSHHDTTTTREGKAHQSCVGESMEPPVGL